ncbi:MAG: FAD-dependent oxidoreductase [Pseudomonadota bacterium]
MSDPSDVIAPANRQAIIIVGAGMAGLACARRLAAAGHTALILDKGRGIGGRMATRRGTYGQRFDHGAQYITLRDPAFQTAMAGLGDAVAAWPEAGAGRVVGVPGMSALPKRLAEGLEIRQQTQVTALGQSGEGWRVETTNGVFLADRLVLTPPSPQTSALLAPVDPALSAAALASQYDPCLTLMLEAGPAAPEAPALMREADGPTAWIARDTSKPGRPVAAALGALWVVQAGPEWSRTHLELSPPEIADRMLPAAVKRLGLDTGQIRSASAHRWRYARVSTPLETPFLCNAEGTIYAGGDWCLGPRVEAAWLSGTAIADALLAAG